MIGGLSVWRGLFAPNVVSNARRRVVQRVMGHKSADTTTNVYCGCESDAAARHSSRCPTASTSAERASARRDARCR